MIGRHSAFSKGTNEHMNQAKTPFSQNLVDDGDLSGSEEMKELEKNMGLQKFSSTAQEILTIKPEHWNNIPFCIVKGMTLILQTLVKVDEEMSFMKSKHMMLDSYAKEQFVDFEKRLFDTREELMRKSDTVQKKIYDKIMKSNSENEQKFIQ